MNWKFWKNEPVIQAAEMATAAVVEPIIIQTEVVIKPESTYAVSKSWDGEKNMGEIGPIVYYTPDFPALRLRSWQAYLESDIAQTILNKYALWIVDQGLKLNCNPSKLFLESEGIKLDTEKFNSLVEARFLVWSKSRTCSFNGMQNLSQIAQQVFVNSSIGGDMLVIMRYKTRQMTIQVIDGENVSSPNFMSSDKIKDGIEYSPTGQHVAYHIKLQGYKWERVVARSSTGQIMAFLVRGNEYRMLDRGLPIIGATLETISKIDRYKEAAVGSAEERAKIAFQIVHQLGATGESPLADALATARNAGGSSGNSGLPIDESGQQLADQVYASTNKTTFNVKPGGEIKSLGSTQEMFFKEFYETNANVCCSAVNIPPNVAFSLYNDSFSASRAATKDWEHTIIVARDRFQSQFYQNVYNFWIYTQILQNKIQAPGYLNGDVLVREAYQIARFTGPLFPHINPVQEVNAERLKLGDLGKNIPLTNVEKATETLNGGDSNSNVEQFATELKKSNDLGLPTSFPKGTLDPNADPPKED